MDSRYVVERGPEIPIVRLSLGSMSVSGHQSNVAAVRDRAGQRRSGSKLDSCLWEWERVGSRDRDRK